ncbi:hypothetical protein I3F58_02825 [Streptomyces sp. MUM 203J]|uniref:hypothetical protein n=1 Tax=Streptomyces sp. MUM 203J TaxID=2791990 RepID=UPI001F035BC0|nr:hypothetical protein [Streptomyces sp. MUM 203J]MCH0538508.1 hypothetical protein [Streptomyces sp. MUM 203J]
MTSTEPDLALPPAVVRALTDGINKAHQELKDLGMIGEASTGRGFADLALSGLELGHDGLAAEFRTFCRRWDWGVRALTHRGNWIATAIGLSAGGLHEQDQYVKGTFKIVVNGLNGNPNAGEDEVTAKSWDQIRTQNPYDGADWSADSFREAHTEVKQTWNDTTYDVNHQLYDSLNRAGIVDDREREALDLAQRGVLKPSDEAVERAKRPAWETE